VFQVGLQSAAMLGHERVRVFHDHQSRTVAEERDGTQLVKDVAEVGLRALDRSRFQLVASKGVHDPADRTEHFALEVRVTAEDRHERTEPLRRVLQKGQRVDGRLGQEK
jgi:hypothetical protein